MTAYQTADNESATEAQIKDAQTTLNNVLSAIQPINKAAMTQLTASHTASKVATGDNSDILAYGTLLFTALGCSLIALKHKKEN